MTIRYLIPKAQRKSLRRRDGNKPVLRIRNPVLFWTLDPGWEKSESARA